MTAENFVELCAIGILGEDDTSETQFAGWTEDITGIEFGEKAFESKALLNGGRVRKRTPMTDEQITLKVIPIGVGKANGMAPWFAGTLNGDTSEPLSIINTNLHKMCRIVLVWAETLPTTASGTANPYAYRLTITNAECIKATPDFGDKDFTGEMVFKWSPFTKEGYSNKKEEGVTSTTLAAVTVAATGYFTS